MLKKLIINISTFNKLDKNKLLNIIKTKTQSHEKQHVKQQKQKLNTV
jgi:hypothetical protein